MVVRYPRLPPPATALCCAPARRGRFLARTAAVRVAYATLVRCQRSVRPGQAVRCTGHRRSNWSCSPVPRRACSGMPAHHTGSSRRSTAWAHETWARETAAPGIGLHRRPRYPSLALDHAPQRRNDSKETGSGQFARVSSRSRGSPTGQLSDVVSLVVHFRAERHTLPCVLAPLRLMDGPS